MIYSFVKLLETVARGDGLTLVTLLETSGSAPQVPGASAVFSAEGLTAGTVGGGTLEARAEELARLAAADGRSRLVEIRLDADTADSEGAICGGAATILVDPRTGDERAAFAAAAAGFRSRQPGILLTSIAPVDGRLAEVVRAWVPRDAAGRLSPPAAMGAAAPELEGVLLSRRPGLFKAEAKLVFAEPVAPLPRLIIAGAGHVGKAVARLGSLLDFEVTVIDDRAAFANAANIPEAGTIIVGDIAQAIAAASNAPDNYFVIVTRGHVHDAEALRACLGRDAAYIGMIGSRTKIALVRRDFLAKGWTTEAGWERVHAPIGLDIGSKTVEEIAVSIAAELVAVRAGLGKEGTP